MKTNGRTIDVWFFTVLIFVVSLSIKYFSQTGVNIPVSSIPIFVSLLAFVFWIFIYRKPVAEIYSKIYPYRRLKAWGVLSSFVFFEYIVMWGLYTGQLKLINEHFYNIIIIFVGAIAFYYTFVRMKVSLRYLFLGIFIPVLALGVTTGMGKYFGFVNFYTPKENISTIFLNTAYLIIFNIFYKLMCEETAFRGFLMQRLLEKGQIPAVIISSFIFAAWRMFIGFFYTATIGQGVIIFFENFIIGCLLAVLFIKGRNLLVAAVSHGIIAGLRSSLFAAEGYIGLNQFFKIASPQVSLKFVLLWLGCLTAGALLILILPPKRRA